MSNGKPPKTEVPGVIGLGEDEAVVTLEGAGFLVEVVREVVRDRDKVGTVIRQDPPGGTPAPEGATVTVVVGRKAKRPRAWLAPWPARPSRRPGPSPWP